MHKLIALLFLLIIVWKNIERSREYYRPVDWIMHNAIMESISWCIAVITIIVLTDIFPKTAENITLLRAIVISIGIFIETVLLLHKRLSPRTEDPI